MPATFDVPSMVVKAHDLFEIGKCFYVRDQQQKKECDQKIEEVLKAIKDASAAIDSKSLPAESVRELGRILDKLNITKNYLMKSVGAFNSMEDFRKNKESELEKKRKQKNEQITTRAKEKRRAISAEDNEKSKVKS